ATATILLSPNKKFFSCAFAAVTSPQIVVMEQLTSFRGHISQNHPNVIIARNSKLEDKMGQCFIFGKKHLEMANTEMIPMSALVPVFEIMSIYLFPYSQENHNYMVFSIIMIPIEHDNEFFPLFQITSK
ncbi:29577_t:CDS:2, partial [Gigaspora margarita]